MSATIPWSVPEILEAVGGRLLTGSRNKIFDAVSIDSRNISGENLFVAIKGEHHDGHHYLKDVLQKGVKGFLVSESQTEAVGSKNHKDSGPVFIAVQDTTKALGDMASYNRRRSGVRVVAITGSNGKTTTRKMCAAVVRRRFSTLSSHGNFNNHIGLPLTLLNLSPEHHCAVLEMGANHPGEIAYLTRICHPDIAVVTNVGPAHLEGFGSLEGVVRAKGELLDHMSSDGVAVLNADDERVVSMADRAPGKVIFYGTSNRADIRASDIAGKKRETCFTLQLPQQHIPVCIKIPGFFMVLNALAAASAGYYLGLEASEIKEALENDFQPAPARMNIWESSSGIHVIDDTYNANPESMAAALRVLKSLKGQHRGIFVAGDMLELGDHAPVLHKKIGETAADIKISRLYAFGPHAHMVIEGATAGGMAKKDVFAGTKEEILSDLKNQLKTGDWVLVKGSRGMGMEQVVEGLKKQTGQL
ncbi:MAG: UDP-N-acetylmuramoyl-tripeptide--D-alanyl-D-alanine ligase [Desulfobacterales bacterium]